MQENGDAREENGRDEMRESSGKNSEGLANMLSTHVPFVPLHCLLSNNRFLKVILLNDGVEREHSCQCFTNVNWLLIDLYFCMYLFLFYVHAHQIIQSATEP